MPDWRVIIAAAIPGFAAIITVRERRRPPGAGDVSWVARPFVPEEDARSGKIERSYYFMWFLAMNALACALVAGLIAPAEAKSSLKKLRSCLEFKDMTKPRLDCYDAIVPPQTKLKPLPAELVVNDCRFLKDDDKRLICFNRFIDRPTKPVAPKATSALPNGDR